MLPVLPRTCEAALLDRFLRAEAMAMWAVRSAQARAVPPHVLRFLRRHEAEERAHLHVFERLVGTRAWTRPRLPRVPHEWCALAVHLYGYEALGLEFAKLLVGLRPDLVSILVDEEAHVGFFEGEIRHILAIEGHDARHARRVALAWWRRLPSTVERYLREASLAPYREALRRSILGAIAERVGRIGLLPPPA